MRPEMLIDLMHNAALTFQRDAAELAAAAIDHAIEEPTYSAIELANHAINLRQKINLIVAEIEPLAVEHIAHNTKFYQEQGKHAH